MDLVALDLLDSRYTAALASASAGDTTALAKAHRALDEMEAILSKKLQCRPSGGPMI